jgi:hypothetical protein
VSPHPWARADPRRRTRARLPSPPRYRGRVARPPRPRPSDTLVLARRLRGHPHGATAALCGCHRLRPLGLRPRPGRAPYATPCHRHGRGCSGGSGAHRQVPFGVAVRGARCRRSRPVQPPRCKAPRDAREATSRTQKGRREGAWTWRSHPLAQLQSQSQSQSQSKSQSRPWPRVRARALGRAATTPRGARVGATQGALGGSPPTPQGVPRCRRRMRAPGSSPPPATAGPRSRPVRRRAVAACVPVDRAAQPRLPSCCPLLGPAQKGRDRPNAAFTRARRKSHGRIKRYGQ